MPSNSQFVKELPAVRPRDSNDALCFPAEIKNHLCVPVVVVLEMIWVLESAYGISRQEIIASINDLLSMPILTFETQPAVQKFIVSARKNNLDLSDLLLAHSAAHSHCDKVYTFDKKASRFKLFELLTK